MSRESATYAGRAAAAEQFDDTFTAYAFTADVVDGLDVQTWAAQGTALGKIPNKTSVGDASTARVVTIGGVERVVIKGGLHLTWSESPEVGMEYVLTTLGPTTHPSLLGKRFHIVETHPTSAMTAWRMDVVEVPSA